LKLINKHNEEAHKKRVKAIANRLEWYISIRSKILDVGSGNGFLASRLKEKGFNITGVDTLVPKKTFISVSKFDGETLPFSDKSFDVILLIDVLHHVRDQRKLLRECRRVADRIIIKDHTWGNPIELFFLYLSDYLSNKPKGVDLPFNFISRSKWKEVLGNADITIESSNWNWKQKKGFDPVRHIFLICK